MTEIERSYLSKTLGPMASHPALRSIVRSAPVTLPMFVDRAIRVSVAASTLRDHGDAIDDAAAAFLALPPDRWRRFARAVFEYRSRRLDSVEESRTLTTPESVWSSLVPTSVLILRDDAVYVVVSAEVDWDGEHGLQLSFESGRRLVRVSACDGHPRPASEVDPFTGRHLPPEPSWDD